MKKFDVVVAGGGPSGVIAGIAAARNGAKTIIVEAHGYLGGMLTAGGVGPMMSFHAGDKLVIAGIANEVIDRLKSKGLSPGHMKDPIAYCATITPFDSEGLKMELEEMALEAGCELLYHAVMTGAAVEQGKIQSITVFTKGGFMEIEGSVFIDATADAELAVQAGISTKYGRDADNLAQPMTMNARVYNVDTEKVKVYMRANPSENFTEDLATIDGAPRAAFEGCYALIKKAKEAGDFSYSREIVLCFETNNPGEYIINMSRIHGLSSIDPFDVTKAEIEGRRQIKETVSFLRKYVPGFENCILIGTGPNIGVRESRKINGNYKLTMKDLIENKMFEDAVVMGGYPVDIHAPDGKEDVLYESLKDGSWYSIPYRCMVADGAGNLIVTGRCISATHEALGAVRTTPSCMALGQAAGTAAAMAFQNNVHVAKIDVPALRAKLVEQGAFLEEYSPDTAKK